MTQLSGCGNEKDPEPPNQAPVFSSPSTFNVSENTRGIASIVASDPENQPVSLRIGGGADGALFRLAPGSGELSFGSAPDFESPRDANGDNLYEVLITATDGDGVSASVPVVVAVLDLAEAPEIQAPSRIEIPEEQAYAYVINASDPEGTALSFNIEGGEDAGLFSIETSTGVLRLDHVPDFEDPLDANADNYHEVRIGVRDGAGELATHDLTVRVTEQNERPAFTSGAGATVPENTVAVATLAAVDPEGEPLEYSIAGGDDGSLFQVSAQQGELVFRQAPDFEAPDDTDGDNLYQVQVAVTDYRGAAALQMMEVQVADRERDMRASLVFPPPGAHFGGRIDQISLLGRLTDLESASLDQADINYIQVDGKRVSPDSGDAGSWHATIPAERRDREILIEVAMADGSQHQSHVVLRNAPFFTASSVAIDPAENRALLPGLDGSGQVVGVDLVAHDREVIGECAGIHRIDQILFDDPGDQVIVAARSANGVPSLWQVSITASGCTRFSGDGAGSGPALGVITGLALDEDVDIDGGENERVLVVNGDDDTVLTVDTVTGERALFASGSVMDPDFSGLGGLVLDTPRYRALVPATGGNDVLYELDLGSGLRNVAAQPLDLAPSSPVAVSSFRNEAYLVNGAGDIASVSLSDGQSSVLAARGRPAESDYLGDIHGLALDASSDRLLIAAADARPTGSLVLARAWSGEKTLITTNAVGEGPWFRGARDMVVDEVAGKAYVLDQGSESAITAADLRTGKRTRHLLSHFNDVTSLAYDFGRNRLLVLGVPAEGNASYELIEVSLPDYSVNVISGFQDPTGPAPVSPGPVALDETNSRIVIADAGLDALLAVDLNSGDHQVLSDNAIGTGPALDHVRDLLVDAAENRFIVVEANRGLLEIDMQSGNRTDLLPPNMAGEHPDAELTSISLDGGAATPLIIGIDGTEVQRIDPASDTVEPMGELAPPPGQGMDGIVSVKVSPYTGLAWLMGDSGRFLVMNSDSGQWALLSR